MQTGNFLFASQLQLVSTLPPQKKEIKERFTIMVIHEGIKQLGKKSLSSLR